MMRVKLSKFWRGAWRLPPTTFAGLRARADPGTHEAVATLLVERKSLLPPGALDLAAGTGSLIARLTALGFGPFDAVELDAASFAFHEIQPMAIDLNGTFEAALQGNYGLITATEIIEHLDSPRAFLQSVASLLAPGGCAVVTTPNLGCWNSRIRFLLKGWPRLFGPEDLQEQRHISPLLDHHFRLIAEESGLDIERRLFAGGTWGWLKKLICAPLILPFAMQGAAAVGGNVIVYVLRKALSHES